MHKPQRFSICSQTLRMGQQWDNWTCTGAFAEGVWTSLPWCKVAVAIPPLPCSARDKSE